MINNEEEIWRVHPEYTGIEVSTFGRVRTLDKVGSRENGTYSKKGHVLKQCNDKDGYLLVGIPINGKRATKRVHRLVAQTFIQNPDNLPQINHKNCNRSDNRVSNLEFCTHEYNMAYKEKYGKTLSKPVYAINLATLEVYKFRSQIEASRVLGFSDGNINMVIKGRLKQANGFWFVNADDNADDAIKRKLNTLQSQVLGL